MNKSLVGVALAACFASAACIMPPTPIAKARETTQEFNLDTRFGRTDSAMERVAPKARDDYAAHHRGWGSSVRIAEVEVAGLKPKGDHDCEVYVRVEWYRPDQQELLTTTLEQTWHDDAGWRLVEERRLDGDVGLLGETVVVEAPTTARPPARFETIRIGGSAD